MVTDATLDMRPQGGLGIALVVKLMDAVEYERRGDRNSCSRLHRYAFHLGRDPNRS